MFLVIRFQYYGTIIIRNFILFFALIGTGMAFIGLFSLTQGLPDQRLAVLGGGPNVFARIIGSTILIVSVFYRNIKEKLPRIVIILLFFGLFVAQISTLSKGPLLSLILVFGLLLIVFNQKRSFVKNLSVTIIVFALVISIMILFNLSERYFLNPFDDVSYGSYGTRFQHFRDSVEIFHASPLIGIGLGDFVEVSSRFTYPHNIFLEILSELGLIGILLFCSGLFFFARSIRTFLKYGITGSNNMINYNKILISLSLFMFLNQLVSGDLMDARFMFVFIILSTILGKELNNRIVNE